MTCRTDSLCKFCELDGHAWSCGKREGENPNCSPQVIVASYDPSPVCQTAQAKKVHQGLCENRGVHEISTISWHDNSEASYERETDCSHTGESRCCIRHGALAGSTLLLLGHRYQGAAESDPA